MKLERQTNLLAKAVETGGIGSAGIGEHGTDLQSASQQHAGLQTNHLYILVLAHIHAVLEIHVILLPLANLKSGLGEDVEHLLELVLTAVGHELISEHEHAVTREDGGVGIPLLVHGLMSAAQVGVVHEVVVEQRVVVVGLEGACRTEDALRIILEEVIGKKHEDRAHALATHRQDISYWLIERHGLAVEGHVLDIIVYDAQNFV